MPHSTFHFPVKIFFGDDVTKSIGSICSNLGNKALLVTSGRTFKDSDIINQIQSDLEKNNINVLLFDEVSQISNSDTVDIAASMAKSLHCDFIIGFGGHKVQNITKAIALLCTNEGESSDFLVEQDGYRLNISHDPLPFVTVPTSFATLAEATPGLLLRDKHDDIKKKLYSEKVYPTYTIIDPKLTITIPEKFLAVNGLMILAYAIELYTSSRANPLVDSYTIRAIELINNNLSKMIEEPDNPKFRSNISMASLLCSLGASCGQLGSLYALANSVSSIFDIYRGTIISLMLPNLMEYNLTVSSGRYVQIARAFGEDVREITVLEAAIKAVEKVRIYVSTFNIPHKLSDIGYTNDKFDLVYNIFSRYEETSFLPREINDEGLRVILDQAF